MKLAYDSRYKNTSLIVDRDNEYFDLRQPIDVMERPDDIFHTVQEGDRIDILAKKYLGNKKYWWVIADYNNLEFPLDLEVGTVLRIPSIQTLHMYILE